MKKLLFVCFVFLSVLVKAQPFNFTITSQSNSFSITCANTILNLSVTANTSNSIQCTWVGPASTSVTANPQSFTIPGSYTVTVTDVVTSSVSVQQFTIFQNVVSPAASVSPLQQAITCVSPTADFTCTVSNPTTNISQSWYSPFSSYPAGPVSANTNFSLSIYTALAPGTHSVRVCDVVNGCCTTKTVSVTTTGAFPSFNASSTGNFVLGCSPANQSTMCIINTVTQGSAAQFAMLPPTSFSSLPLPSNAFSSVNCTVSTFPGTWTLVVNDPSNSCQAGMQVVVTQNTVAPAVSASMLTKTLTCFTPTVLATGSSTTQGTQISWIVPSTPSVVSGNTVVVGAPTGPPTSTTNTTYATWTVVATNTMNACKTTSAIVISQNFRAPMPLISVGNPSVISCVDTAIVLSFTNIAVTSSVAGAAAIVDSWMGPTQTSTVPASTFTAYSAGVYTLTVHDSYNGCVGMKTIFIPSSTNGCVSIKTNSLPADLVKLYPNPASGYIDISVASDSKAFLSITDVQGRIVLTESLHEKNNRVYLKLEKGLYIARITIEGKGYRDEKLVIE